MLQLWDCGFGGDSHTHIHNKTMLLAKALLFVSIPFVLATLYFGTRGGYYDSKDYKGNGTAH